MNSQQAINLLKGLEQSLDDYCGLNDEGKAAFRMAITALELFGKAEQLPSAQPECKQECMPMYANVCDTISRQAAIDALFDWEMTYDWDEHCREEDPKPAYIVSPSDVIEQLPSAQPQRIKGRWVDGRCLRCGEHAPFHPMASTYYESNFCPNCGSDNRGDEDAAD